MPLSSSSRRRWLGDLIRIVAFQAREKLPVLGTPYAVYYHPDLERGEIAVLAVWSSMRRRGPPLG